MSTSISIENIKIPYPTEGIIRTAQLDDTVAPADSAQMASNFNFDRVGAIQTRNGVTNYAGSFPSQSPSVVLSFGTLKTNGATQTLVDFPSNNQDASKNLFFLGTAIEAAQCFLNPIAATLKNVEFFLQKHGTISGNIQCTVYLVSGTLGTNAIPFSSAIATSDNVDLATVGLSYSQIKFNFSGAQQITLSAGQKYAVAVTFASGDASNYLQVGINNSSVVSGQNAAYLNVIPTWTTGAPTDNVIFYLNGAYVGGVRRLYAQVATEYYVWDQTSWTLLEAFDTLPLKARWAQFLNYVWRVNGAQNGPVVTSNGGAFGTDLVPADFPPGDFISCGFEGRVWVADSINDIIWYTDIVQFTPPDTFVLTFDKTVNFIQDFSPQDGQSMTGLFRVPRALLVFKQDTIYRIYGATSIDSYPAYNVGTYSQESIIQTKDGIYFHHSSGFYQFNYDGQPTEISRRVIDFIQAIPLSAYANIVGIYNGFDAVEWSVGSVTVEGVTYKNCVMRYTISTQVWTIYDYFNGTVTQDSTPISINAMVVYDDGTRINNLMGTVSSTNSAERLRVVGRIDDGFTDFGIPIYYEYIDRWRTYADMYAKSQSISGFNLYSENAAGARVEYQIQKQPPNVWGDIGIVNENNMSLFPNASTDDFEVARLRISGNSSGTPIVIHGMEILSVNIKGYDTN